MQREVIKWVQSLDLSFPIKNPRRDLANGFLIAEILSRYDKDVAMHSFGTELAMQQRINNWQQISKILERMRCVSVTKELIEGTMQQKGLCGRDLLDQLYTFLTKRQLKPNVMAPPVRTVLEQHGYARPTAAALLREANDATKLRLQQMTGDVDELKARNTNEGLLKMHNVALQSLKIAEPDRYLPRKPPTYANMHSASREASSARLSMDRSRSVPTREVEIRAMDDSILHTFAERDQKNKEEALRSGFSREDDLSTALSRILHRPLSSFGLLHDLDEALPQAPQGTEYFQKFAVLRRRIPVQIRGKCWEELHSVSRNIAKHVALRPIEFEHLTVNLQFAFGKDAALIPLLRVEARGAAELADDAPTDTYDVEQAFALLEAVGKLLVTSSPEISSAVLDQFLIPALLPLIRFGTVGAVEAAARVLTSYVHHNHLDGIRKLVASVDGQMSGDGVEPPIDRERFVLVTAHILGNIDFTHCVGVDVVARYFAAEAIVSQRAVCRGAAILMLLPAAACDVVELAAFTTTVAAFVNDPSWEVRLLALELLLVYHRAVTREDSAGGPSVSSRRASTQADGSDEEVAAAAAARRDRKLQNLVDELPLVRSQINALLGSFDGVLAAPLQRAAALTIAAQYLDNDVGSVDDIGVPLVVRMAKQIGDAKDSVLLGNSAGASVEGTDWIRGRVRTVIRTSGLQETWSVPSVAASVLSAIASRDTKDKLSTLQAVLLIEALTQSAPNLAESDVWTPFLQQTRTLLLTAATNPGQCVGVKDKDLPYCSEAATNAIVKLYTELSGEVEQEEPTDEAEIRSKAIEWLQMSVE